MNAVLEEDKISVAEFALHALEHTSQLKETGRTMRLTHDGETEAVMMSASVYEKLAWDAYEHRMDQRLRVALEAYAKGERGIPAAEFFGQLEREDAATEIHGA
jgi:PHD/YefM family antitoxin component YafN of YafNO toxin-antitoxin module